MRDWYHRTLRCIGCAMHSALRRTTASSQATAVLVESHEIETTSRAPKGGNIYYLLHHRGQSHWHRYLFISLAWHAAAVGAEEPPEVVPYRPTVSTAADLPAPGYPELEAGYLTTRGGGSTRNDTVPLTFVLAWSSQWGVLIDTVGYAREREFNGTTAQSGGDTSLLLKYKLPIREDLALGWQFGPTLPTARPPIGSRETDWNLTGIASADFGDLHVDANIGAVRVGAITDDRGRVAANWSLAGSYPLNDRFTGAIEVSGNAQRGTNAASNALAALSYNVSRTLVVDVAISAGLSRSAPNWQFTTGFSLLLGHWF